MARIPRRKFLAQYGGGALAMKISGIAGILASGRAPAFAQGTTLHWLRVNDFVPASDAFLRKELLPEAEKALGLKINLETTRMHLRSLSSSVGWGLNPGLVETVDVEEKRLL